MAIINKMRVHGEKIKDVTVVEKILWSMMPNFNYVVCTIEEWKDLDQFYIDELQGSLLVHEQKITQQENEEQALKVSTENHSTPNIGDKGWGRGRGKVRGYNDCGNQQQHQYPDNQFRRIGWGGHHSTTYRPRSAEKSTVECYRCIDMATRSLNAKLIWIDNMERCLILWKRKKKYPC